MINKARVGISIVIISLLMQVAIVMSLVGVPYYFCVGYVTLMSCIVLNWMVKE